MRGVLVGANSPPGFTKVPEALDAVYVASAFLTYRFGSAGKLASPSRLVELTGTKPTKKAVSTALANAAKDSAAGDLFVLLFSGHGGNPKTEQYFQLHDATLTDSELADAINAFDPGVEVVVVADCCHAAKLFQPGPFIKPIKPIHPGLIGHPGPTLDLDRFRKQIGTWLNVRRRNVLAKLAKPADFVLAASASGIQRHANGQSEFVRTLTEAIPAAAMYKDIIAEMKALVPVPEEQANWSVDGRPKLALDRAPLKKS